MRSKPKPRTKWARPAVQSGPTNQSDPKPEWLRDMQVMNLRIGDVIVLRHPGVLTEEAIRHLKICHDNMFPDNRCLILEEGIDIGVVSKEATAETLKKRLEAAEAYIKASPIDPDINDKQRQAYRKWQDFKNPAASERDQSERSKLL